MALIASDCARIRSCVVGEFCSFLMMAVPIATSNWQGLADEAVKYANTTDEPPPPPSDEPDPTAEAADPSEGG